MRLTLKPFFIGVSTIATTILVDQTSKAWIVANAEQLSLGLEVFSGFRLVFGRNDGVAFGLLREAPWWTLSALAMLICAWIVVQLYCSKSRVEALAYGLILGGAIGNIIDRLRFGAVTDFLDFYIGSMHWPAFNMADVFVVCGVALLIAAPYMRRKSYA